MTLSITSTSGFAQTVTGVTATAAEVNILDGSSLTVAELDAYALTVDLPDVSTAQSVWVVAPHAGTIEKIYSVIDGTIATSDAALSFEIGGTAVTSGGITITASGSAAGDVDSSTPSALNAVTAGQAIEVITDGASTNTVGATITFLISR